VGGNPAAPDWGRHAFEVAVTLEEWASGEFAVEFRDDRPLLTPDHVGDAARGFLRDLPADGADDLACCVI
jgi:hypothetical protein